MHREVSNVIPSLQLDPPASVHSIVSYRNLYTTVRAPFSH